MLPKTLYEVKHGSGYRLSAPSIFRAIDTLRAEGWRPVSPSRPWLLHLERADGAVILAQRPLPGDGRLPVLILGPKFSERQQLAARIGATP